MVAPSSGLGKAFANEEFKVDDQRVRASHILVKGDEDVETIMALMGEIGQRVEKEPDRLVPIFAEVARRVNASAELESRKLPLGWKSRSVTVSSCAGWCCRSWAPGTGLRPGLGRKDRASKAQAPNAPTTPPHDPSP